MNTFKLTYKQAIHYHKEGNIPEALKHYQEAFNKGASYPVLFQNFGSLLRQQGDLDNAIIVFKRGIKLHPNNASILYNFANLYQAEKPFKAILMYRKVIQIKLSEDQRDKQFQQSFISLASTLRSTGLRYAAANLSKRCLEVLGPTPSVLLQLLQSVGELSSGSSSTNPQSLSEFLFATINECTDTLEPDEQIELHIALAGLKADYFDLAQSIHFCEKGIKLVEEFNISSFEPKLLSRIEELSAVLKWNYSNLLLKSKDLSRGWTLFDYGLRVAAPGKQKWQRALFKPFNFLEVPIWRGESLSGKRLLVLEEQAVGDIMMFLTLIKSLLPEIGESGHLSIALGSRLYPIYRRSFSTEISKGLISILQKKDFFSEQVSSHKFDCQIPLGSICQYRFSRISDYPSNNLDSEFQLISNNTLRNHLRSISCDSSSFLVGVSWRGGGSKGSMQQKSVDIDTFGSLLQKFPHINFVDLQYGDTSAVIGKWKSQGINIVSHNNINPLQNMDDWLAAVASCDAVLSVANTTIHGAGGLGKPTLCLLSNNPDWRWFIDPEVTKSYWYRSVKIARQSDDGSWLDAFKLAEQWLSAGCPPPLPTELSI